MPPERATSVHNEELLRILVACEALDADVYALLEGGWNSSSQRQVICMAYCKAAVVHAISQRVLIENGLHGSALSLIRLHFEHCGQGSLGASWRKGRMAGEVFGASATWGPV